MGTRLTLLVLLPVAGLLACAAVPALARWHETRTLEQYRAATQVSYATAGLYEAVARERLAEVLARTVPDRAGLSAERAAARNATDRALAAAQDAAAQDGVARLGGRPGVLRVLDSVRGRLRTARPEPGDGAGAPLRTEQRYAAVATRLLDTAGRLVSSRPAGASRRSGDAWTALLGAVEAAERERARLAVLLAEQSPDRYTGLVDGWPTLEAARLDAFRQAASRPLRERLSAALEQPAERTVRAFREALVDAADSGTQLPSPDGWLTASADRLTALRGVAHAAAAELADDTDHDLADARERSERELALFAGVLCAVLALTLALRRSVVRPLAEVSLGARALADGDLSYEVHYRGRDETGVVADSLRELHLISTRLTAEIRAMSTAIDDNRLGHRADVAAFHGTWARLLDDMNATMVAFAAGHGRRRRAERELAGVFNLSLDLLCICGTDGRFKRVNPAFERILGHGAATLSGTSWTDLAHPEDRERTRAALDRLADGVALAEFENRCVRDDGTEVWLQWSARPVTGEGLVYAAARDVTRTRRADREQAALRRVATLVARGDPPREVFSAVAREVGLVLGTGAVAVLRYGADGAATVLGSAPGAVPAPGPAAGVVPTFGSASGTGPAPGPLPAEGAGGAGGAGSAGGGGGAGGAGSAGGGGGAGGAGSAGGGGGAGEEAARVVASTRRAARAGRSVGAPIVVDDRLWGAVVAAPTGPESLPPGTEHRLADFTELVAAAIANADSRAQLTASRARVMAAADASRRRIERDLHDGVQQRLVTLRLGLRMAESLTDGRPAGLAEQLAHLGKGLDDAFEDLLRISRGIHPAILSQGGLGPALRALARRSAVPVELDLRLPAARLPERTEVAVYYVTSECLTNAVKHAHATVVQVEAHTYDDVLTVSIRDDGTGGAEPGGGSGLIGLIDRVEAIGGRLAVGSPRGSGTTVTVRLPLRDPRPGHPRFPELPATTDTARSAPAAEQGRSPG
ncbi:PAS domain S-box protein [Streptomyces siamensis]|uniref:histidine kinase n=1 Tax=Streptomyces siamensis TaxID=1274986 RepID=A0ABP9JAF9_9ACTN